MQSLQQVTEHAELQGCLLLTSLSYLEGLMLSCLGAGMEFIIETLQFFELLVSV